MLLYSYIILKGEFMKFVLMILIISSWLFGAYTRDSVRETVTDSETGLIWQDNSDVSTQTHTWAEASTYCSNLDFSDQQGWRFPSIDELETISDTYYELPAISPVFQNVEPEVYWSSTYSGIGSGYYQTVDFSYGSSHYAYFTQTAHVICVSNNTPPIFNSDSDSLSHNQTEGVSYVLIIDAKDADSDNLSYTLSAGLDSQQFTINSETGFLSFIVPPVYLSPTDSNQDNIYEVEVSVNDGNGGTDSVSILITVLNPNIAPYEEINTGSYSDNSGYDIISSTELNFHDDTSDNSSIIYTIISDVLNGELILDGSILSTYDTFTQEDINNNLVVYIYDGSNIKNDSFNFNVSDGAGGETTNQSFNFTPAPKSSTNPAIIMYLLN